MIHGFANPARFLRFANWLMPLCMGLGIIVCAAALTWGLLGAPAERLQGETVRIVYFHVRAAWLGMTGWMGIAGRELYRTGLASPACRHRG